MAVKIQETNLTHYRKLPIPVGTKVYMELRKKVTQAGILDQAYGYYTILFIFDFSGLAFFLLTFILSTNIAVLIGSSVGTAFFAVRVGGLVHDAGHRSIFKSTRLNDIAGYIVAFIMATSFSIWKQKHNAHHAHTNEQGEDPDLEIPFSFTEDRPLSKNPVMRLIQKYQPWLYYPLGSLVSFSMRLKTMKFNLTHLNKRRALELLSQSIGIFFWYVLPFLIFPVWKAVLFFILVNELAGFYLLNVFAPNHKGMPQIAKGTKLSFLEQQIVTSRNIYGHWFTDYVYLGLNYQIEHHLFPNCPRNKLKRITPYLKQICKKYKLSYIQMGPVASNIFILSELNKTSKLLSS